MKISSIFIPFVLFGTFCFAQVGINTETPRTGAALDINGSFKMEEIILPALKDASTVPNVHDDFVYLIQDQNNGQVSYLDLSAGGSNSGALSTLVTFKLTNVDGDWVENFDTKISSSQYALVVLSASFDRNILGTHPAMPVTRAKAENGTWRLEADYSAVSSSTNGTWSISCVVYPKTYVKTLGTNGVTTVSMNGATTASATTPIVN